MFFEFFEFFENKIFLFLLLIAPILFILGMFGFAIKKSRIQKFINSKLLGSLVPQESKDRQILKLLFKIFALIFFIIALAGPKFGTKIVDINRKGLDVLIALDTSLSMLSEDIKPNRISLAKAELSNIADALAENRVGIIAFAGESFLQCPLTLDINTIKLFLDFALVGTVPQDGTNIASVLKLAIKTFDQKEQKYKVLILLSDGEDHSSEILSQIQEAKKAGIKIFTIGFGKKSGELIPIRDKNSRLIDYKRDDNGNIVMSRLDEDLLKTIAENTGGKYYYSQNGFLAIDRIVSDINALAKKDLNSKTTRQYEPRFYYFVLIGLLFLIMDFFTKETKALKMQKKSTQNI